jgi:hypothetical protein
MDIPNITTTLVLFMAFLFAILTMYAIIQSNLKYSILRRRPLQFTSFIHRVKVRSHELEDLGKENVVMKYQVVLVEVGQLNKNHDTLNLNHISLVRSMLGPILVTTYYYVYCLNKSHNRSRESTRFDFLTKTTIQTMFYLPCMQSIDRYLVQ